jgi:hypothetical protein
MEIRWSGYKPEPKFFLAQNEVRTGTIETYGFELEVCGNFNHEQTNEDFAYEVGNIFTEGSIFCKADCSLDQDNGYDGVELVSHPMTYEYMVSEEYATKLRRLFYAIIDGGHNDSYDNLAGLHIHIGLTAFVDEAHVKRFAQIFDLHFDRLFSFSNREDDRWCPPSGTDPHQENDDYFYDFKSYNRHYSKYQAVNTAHPHTVEVRLFKGCDEYIRFMHCINLVRVLLHITKSPKRVRSIKWNDIVQFANDMGLDELSFILGATY